MRDMHEKRNNIYLWPNLVTTAALLSGFSAVLLALDAYAVGFSDGPVKVSYMKAVMLVFLAMIFDGLDGRVARWTESESRFGEEYDSLSDLISFGIAPAVIIYLWSLKSLSSSSLNIVADFAWFAAYVYLACTALRLARFNVQIESTDRAFFTGLPSPSAAGIVVGFVWACESMGISGYRVEYFSLLLTLYSGIMMVSNVKFYSFKTFRVNRTIPFYLLAPLVAGALFVLVLLIQKPGQVLFTIFFIYGLSGPIYTLYRRFYRVRRARRMRNSEKGVKQDE